MTREFVAQHTCEATVRVIDDGLIRPFFDEAGARLHRCPRCKRPLTRGKLRPVIEERVRGERR